MRKFTSCILAALFLISAIGIVNLTANEAYFGRSRTQIFNLLANPKKIEPDLDTGWQYAVSGWERSDLSDDTPRWLTISSEIYIYELIGKPANKFTFIGGITGESQNLANFLMRAALVMRVVGVAKDQAGTILNELVQKAVDNPNTEIKRETDDIMVKLTFLKSTPALSLTLEAT